MFQYWKEKKIEVSQQEKRLSNAVIFSSFAQLIRQRARWEVYGSRSVAQCCYVYVEAWKTSTWNWKEEECFRFTKEFFRRRVFLLLMKKRNVKHVKLAVEYNRGLDHETHFRHFFLIFLQIFTNHCEQNNKDVRSLSDVVVVIYKYLDICCPGVTFCYFAVETFFFPIFYSHMVENQKKERTKVSTSERVKGKIFYERSAGSFRLKTQSAILMQI